MERIVRENYAKILNRDLVKSMVDNLQKKYPALIVGTVPERISYGLLTDVFKKFVEKGNSPRYFSRIIELLDSEKRRNVEVAEEEFVVILEKEFRNSAK